MTIEGTLVLSPEGKLLDIMRFGKRDKVIAYEVDTAHSERMLTYSSLIDFPANYSKFMIKYDGVSGCYYSLANRNYDEKTARNLLSLMRSKDLRNWETVSDILDHRHCDRSKVGFQYVDFEFEGDDIIFLCRTAINGAHSFHDSNYSTFHRIRNFREL